LFCLHAGSLEKTFQGLWLVLGLLGFALWVLGRALSRIIGRFLRPRPRIER
jgi:flagellar biogenesis protein FliO